MASTKMATVEVTCNTKRAKAAIKEYERLASEAMENLAKLTAVVNEQQKQGIKITKEQAAEMKKLEDDIKTYTSAQQRGIDDLRKAKNVLNDLANSSIKEVNKAIRDMTKSMNGMRDIDGIRKTQADIEKLRQTLNDKLKPTVNEIMKDFKNLNTLSLDQLNQNIETLRQKWASMSERERMGINGQGLQRAISSYEAQAAVVRYGAARTSDLSNMGLEKLQAERSRLSAAYNATEGSMMHKGISQEYLTRLQAVNQAIKNITESEREAARAAKEADEAAQRRIEFAQQGQRTHQTLANMEKASYEDLEAALKHLQEQYKTYASGDVKHIQRNLASQDRLKQKMKEMQSLLLTDQELSDRVNNKKKYSIIQLQQAYDQLKAKLSNLAVGETEAIEKTQKQMKSLQKEISKAKGELTGFAKLWNTALKNIGAYMGVFAAFGFVRNKFMEVARSSLSISDAMAQVQKTTGLTKQEVDELNKSFAKLDTRTTIAQLNDLAFSAGKMGLGKYGLEGIEGFVKATNQLQVALGDDLGNSVEESITPLAKLAENMGLIQKMGVEKSMMAIGSSINELSQTTTAAGRNIVDFTRRIQPTAQMLGLTVDQVLALGSASDAFGVSAEVSATAFTKFLSSYRTNTEAIEQALGIAKGTLDDFYNKGQTIEGLLLIFQRMHDIGDIRVLAPIFKELGSEGSRMFETFGAFSKNIDQLRDHVLTSELAFEEATSVTREYNLVQDTAAGILERANNIWEKAFVNPEGVDMVKQLSIEWYNLSKELTNSATWIDFVQLLLKRTVFVIETLIKLLPTLIKAMFFYGMAQAVRKIYIQFTMLNTAMATATTTAGKLSAFMKSNLWVLAGTAILFAASAIYDMATASSKAKKEADAMGDALKKASDEGEKASAKERAELKRLYDATQDQKKAIEERTKAALELKRKYPDYFADLTTEQILAGKAAEAYQNLAQQILNAAKARAMEKKIEQLQEENINLEDDNRKREQWRDDNQKKYEEEKAKIDRAVDQQNRMETAGASPVGGKMGYVHATNAGDKQFVGEYQVNDQAITDNSDKIKENTAVMERLAEEVSKIKPTTTSAGTDTLIPPTSTEEDKGKGDSKKAKEIKDKFDDEKKRVEGLIAKIDQWYNLQDATINEFAATGKITDDEAKKALDAMKIARNMALEKARLAVASGDDTDWKKFYTENMQKMMVDHGEWSTELFKQIGDVDVMALHDFLATIQDPEIMAKLDASSFFDTMRKKAAESKKVVSETQAKAAEELNKMLLKYEYFDKAARQFASNLIQIGALGTTAEQMAKGMEGAPTAEQSIEAVKGMLAAMLRQGTALYKVNPSDAKGVADAIRTTVTQTMTEADYLAGNTSGEQAHWFDMFPELKDWMDNPEQHKKELENFYNVMLQAEDTYYKKRKESFNFEKQQLDQRNRAMGYTDEEERTTTALENRGKLKDAGIGASFMEQQGLGSITNDPEVQAIQTRIYYRNLDVESAKARLEQMKVAHQQELEYMEKHGASLEEIQQRQQELQLERMGMEDLLQNRQTALYDQQLALVTKVGQEMQKRVQTINSLTKPIQDGAKNIGQKFGEMIRGVEEDSMTWNEIWRSMAQAVGDSVIDMMAQYAQNMIMEKMMTEQSKQNAISQAQVAVPAGIASGGAKTVGQLGWWGLALIPVIAAVLHGLLAAALASNKSDNNTASSSSPKAKLASGMLTYDSGNVQSYVGTDGHMYKAHADATPKTGLITKPIATTVQGNPALVAERGPEIVVGRRATANIMRFNPELVNILSNYDRQHITPRLRTYDEGTDMSAFVGLPNGKSTAREQENAQLATALTEMTAMMQSLAQTNAQLSSAVTTMNQRGVKAVINKYGTGGLIDEVKSGLKFVNRYD